MDNLQIKYKQIDKDSKGNAFPSLHVKFGEHEIKHMVEEEMPVVVGLHTGHEVHESELAFIQKMQLPIIQPYGCFFEDRLKIWNCFPPKSFMQKADAEVMYADLRDWKKL